MRSNPILWAGLLRVMGNAGGFSSSSTHSVSGPEQSSSQQQQNHELSDRQLQDMAKNFEVSRMEIQLLWKRFKALGPSDSGTLDRAVFQRPPYGEDIFCRQIWRRFSASREAPHQISFESFARSMIWWQKAHADYKLQLLFSWMSDVDGITPHILSRILKHVLLDYHEDELKQIAELMIKTISPSAEPLVVKQEEFRQWLGQLPEEELRDALRFKILHTDTGTSRP